MEKAVLDGTSGGFSAMTVKHYEEAIRLLRNNHVTLLSPGGASKQTIDALERILDTKLPPSYKAMLSDFGILGFVGKQVYGLGKSGIEGTAVPNVVFATQSSRRLGEISDKMIRIMSSGYGPDFVLDCNQVNKEGESPVYLINELGYKSGSSKISESFGEFFLSEVQNYLING